MAAKPARRLFTVAEYYQMGCAGILAGDERVELIEGDVVEMPSIGVGHASVVNRISQRFSAAFGESVLMTVQNPLHLNERSEPVPDVMLVRPRPDFYATHHPEPHDVLLLVEVSDTTLTYDTKVKLPLYARHGVPEVWIADISSVLVRVYSGPTPTGYRVAEVKRKGERLNPTAFPDHSFLVDDILG